MCIDTHSELHFGVASVAVTYTTIVDFTLCDWFGCKLRTDSSSNCVFIGVIPLVGNAIFIKCIHAH